MDSNTLDWLPEGSLIIMVGFPLSGKSTLARRCVEYGKKVVTVCPDTIRLVLQGNQSLGHAEPLVRSTAKIMVRILLKEGYTVIVDSTNTTIEQRKVWVSIAKECNIKLGLYWVDTPKEVCMERNTKINRLAPSIINKMALQFEAPTWREGYIYMARDIERLLIY